MARRHRSPRSAPLSFAALLTACAAGSSTDPRSFGEAPLEGDVASAGGLGVGGNGGAAASAGTGGASTASVGAGGSVPSAVSTTGSGGAGGGTSAVAGSGGAPGTGGGAAATTSAESSASSASAAESSASSASAAEASASSAASTSTGAGGGGPSCLDSASCDDGVFCNGAEVCDPLLGCVAGTMPSCDDGVGCTSDLCDLGQDACIFVPSDSACDDGAFCNGAESCDPMGGCVQGKAVECADSVGCTLDACDEASDACAHVPNDAACDDGSFCNGAESCMSGVGCVAGSAVVCDDARSCTADACDDLVGACVFTANDAACQDGVFCNGAEHCEPTVGDAATGCVGGLALGCASDGIACTEDVCDEGALGCVHVPASLKCKVGETCVIAGGGCVPGKACGVDADCQDADLCNGAEICDAVLHVCKGGTPKSCNDGLSCTKDACVPATGACTAQPMDAICDDGFACNGLERCDTAKGCVVGAAVSCDDGIACTFDACEEPSGSCAHLVQHGVCDDGLYCTGSETCDPKKGCVAGVAPTCTDGVACTMDVCDPLADACVAVADDALCACGETCDPKAGCGKYCVPSTCQGKTYACGNCLDDDGDCRVDTDDAMCLGPCDNSEDSFDLAIPGANNAPCKQDCYFDGDTGAGNDDCAWSHTCDPLEVGPNYYPEGPKCSYDAKSKISGTSLTCSQALAAQSSTCNGICGPLTPNGCDCFGCCLVPGAAKPVWLGSTDANGNSSCTVDSLGDPTKCHPCTQVAACLNPCETCELCVGKEVLPPECSCQECPAGAALCGGPCGTTCPFGSFCQTGCCVLAP